MTIRDIYMAAYLMTEGFTLSNLVRSNQSRKPTLFEFSDDATQLREAMLAYANGQAKVDAVRFVDAIKNIKSLIHNL